MSRAKQEELEMSDVPKVPPPPVALSPDGQSPVYSKEKMVDKFPSTDDDNYLQPQTAGDSLYVNEDGKHVSRIMVSICVLLHMYWCLGYHIDNNG